jgi:hypothetical protein
MNTGYTVYQVERTKSAAEQREIDRSNAELAAAISRLWRALAAPWRARAAPSRARRRPVWVTAPGHEAMRNGPGACPAGPGGRGQYAPAGRVTTGDPVQGRQARRQASASR